MGVEKHSWTTVFKIGDITKPNENNTKNFTVQFILIVYIKDINNWNCVYWEGVKGKGGGITGMTVYYIGCISVKDNKALQYV